MAKKIILLLLLFFAFTGKALAFKAETFVTFANPVRGNEGWQTPKQSPLDLPRFQYQESTHSAYPITWLLRYDAVYDATISAFFDNLIKTDKTQSLGAFLEITPVLSLEANVIYPAGNSIFNANRVFLSGYSIEDRQRLIDTYMELFFRRFGFYPSSVSAWHLDSFSLQYLQSRYSVITAMNCDDQYSTDHYRLWGGYLGSPYFPDKNNSLIPASSFNEKINLTMVRWAQRDLFNFYGGGEESKYSVQMNDYLSMGQDTKYFEKLVKMYEQKNFNLFTYLNIGLENDYDLKLYRQEIKNVFKVVKDNQERYNLKPISLAGFGDWFKARYPESSPAYFYQTTDPAEKNSGKVFWYQSPFYRLGLKSDGGQTTIIDFRVYNREIYEDHYSTPNQSLSLYHEIPAVVDSVKFKDSVITMDIDLEKAIFVHSKQWDNWQISATDSAKIFTLEPNRIVFTGFVAPDIASKEVRVVKKEDRITWDLSPFTPFRDTTRLSWFFWITLFLVVAYLYRKRNKPKNPLFIRNLIIGVVISLIAGFTLFRNGLIYPFGMGFWGPNGHDAIFHLSLINSFSLNLLNFSHPQIAGENIANYHFLFDYLAGLIVKFSGISAIDFYFRIFPIAAGILIVVLLDRLLASWSYSRSERLLSVLLAFLAGSLGFVPRLLMGQDLLAGESAFWSNQSVSIFLNPPFAISIIGLLLFLNLLNSNHRITTLIVLGGLLSQTKIYAFILVLGALFFSKKYKLFVGVLVLGILVSLPFTDLGGPSPFIFSPLWFPRSLFASYDRFYWPELVTAWQAYEASGSFVKLSLVNLLALVVFIVGNLGVRCFGLWEIVKSKPLSSTESLVRWVVILGLITPLLFVQNINPWNTIQFMYYSLFFLAIFTARFISRQKWFVILLLLVLALITTVGTLRDYVGFFSSSRVSYTELAALDKLKDQPRGVVLAPPFSMASSRAIFAPKPLYSYVSTAYISALSGQPEFLSDTINLDITNFDYRVRIRDIQRFYNTEDRKWAIDYLTTNNIRYVYETPLQKIKLSPEDLKLHKIFDSGEVNIYKFN